VTRSDPTQCSFVDAFRHSAPYIHQHRGRDMVIAIAGEAVEDKQFPTLIRDIALLNTLGIRVVLVHGARPQIEQRLKAGKAAIRYAHGLRITDDAALLGVKEAVGRVRLEVEAQLSMNLSTTAAGRDRLRVATGNFVTARPLGVRDGVDYQHTGEVRRIDGPALQQALDARRLVLLSPLGYSPTGEVFNLHAEEVALAAARELRADKLILLVEGKGLRDGNRQVIHELSPTDAQALLNGRRKLDEDMRRHIETAACAAREGVQRVHLIGRASDGALLQELFTRDGVGTLVTTGGYEGLRQATIYDVGGILDLIRPLEENGILVKRSRERLEMEIDRFLLVERDGLIIACAALYPDGKAPVAELAGLAVHPDYRNEGRGDRLLKRIEQLARQRGIKRLFVLTTRTAHWFQERGFKRVDVASLPERRRDLYNYQRNSQVYSKILAGT